MKNFFKDKIAILIIVLATLILAGVAIFTATRLYQLRQQPVAPNVPYSIPKAQEVTSCSLSFTLTPATSLPTASASGTPAATPTAAPGTPNSCGGTCGSDSNCQTGLICYNNFCREPACKTSTDCVCGETKTTAPTSTPKATAGGKAKATATPTPTPAKTATATKIPASAVTATPTATGPSLPQSGIDWPTIVAAWFGAAVILGSLLLAL